MNLQQVPIAWTVRFIKQFFFVCFEDTQIFQFISCELTKEPESQTYRIKFRKDVTQKTALNSIFYNMEGTSTFIFSVCESLLKRIIATRYCAWKAKSVKFISSPNSWDFLRTSALLSTYINLKISDAIIYISNSIASTSNVLYLEKLFFEPFAQISLSVLLMK